MLATIEVNKYTLVADTLSEQGWAVFENFLDDGQVDRLARESRILWREGNFRHAGVGRGETLQIRPEIRRDHVHWLQQDRLTPAQQAYFADLEALRMEINQRLFLGLFEFEGHLTCYPPGAFYRKHLDQFQGARHRIVTCVLYLNQDWRDEDGGCLRFYTNPRDDGEYFDITPRGGTLVSFLSADYYHEVLPARRERLSLTGWFRARG